MDQNDDADWEDKKHLDGGQCHQTNVAVDIKAGALGLQELIESGAASKEIANGQDSIYEGHGCDDGGPSEHQYVGGPRQIDAGHATIILVYIVSVALYDVMENHNEGWEP